jgi:ubiquitin-protein ligase E3 A
VDWVLTTSVQPAFTAFHRGFVTVLDGHALTLCSATELELLVAGSPHLDLAELEAATVYDGGFGPEHPTVRAFWRVAKALPHEEQKRLLTFVTGSDRAPIGGLGKLPFRVQRNGGDSDRLPTASTCFNTLLLNEYASEEKLRERLRTAINEGATGFALK